MFIFIIFFILIQLFPNLIHLLIVKFKYLNLFILLIQNLIFIFFPLVLSFYLTNHHFILIIQFPIRLIEKFIFIIFIHFTI